MSTDTELIVFKCQEKLRLAKQLDREAEGFSEKKKDAQKRADALRAEVERLIVDPSQTEIALVEEAEPEHEAGCGCPICDPAGNDPREIAAREANAESEPA